MTDTAFTTDVYHDSDADVSYLDNKTVGVVGYGSQGHAHAQNLADSGVDVIVGLRPGSPTRDAARDDGFTVATPAEVAKDADIVSMLVPDAVQPTVFEEVRPGLSEGDTLQFAHGFNIHYGQVTPPEDVDVTMIAPKGPGHLVRRNFTEGEGTPGLLAVEQDYTGTAKEEALAYAKALGCTRAGVVQTTFREETETDLFGEQAVLCGGVTELVKAAFETLVEAGYSPELAYFECMNELKLIVDLMYEGGLAEMWDSVSDTAEYGGLTRGSAVVDERVRENMDGILEAVQDGSFAEEWVEENRAGRPTFQRLSDEERAHEIEDVGARLRTLFAWAEGDEAVEEPSRATDGGRDKPNEDEPRRRSKHVPPEWSRGAYDVFSRGGEVLGPDESDGGDTDERTATRDDRSRQNE